MADMRRYLSSASLLSCSASSSSLLDGGEQTITERVMDHVSMDDAAADRISVTVCRCPLDRLSGSWQRQQ